MKAMLIILLLALSIETQAQADDEQYKMFVLESSLPGEISDFYHSEKIKSNYSIRTDLNPFYLRGDFNGDKKQDYALGVRDKKTNMRGIIIYHTGTRQHFIIGAGQPLLNRNTLTDFNWMDAWQVYTSKTVEQGVGEIEKIILKGEGILTIKTESSSGLIYWTGKEYAWYQQGD